MHCGKYRSRRIIAVLIVGTLAATLQYPAAALGQTRATIRSGLGAGLQDPFDTSRT